MGIGTINFAGAVFRVPWKSMKLIRIETKVTQAVYNQLCQLATAHTHGRIAAMHSIIVSQACTGQEYAYALEIEQELKAKLDERKAAE